MAEKMFMPQIKLQETTRNWTVHVQQTLEMMKVLSWLTNKKPTHKQRPFQEKKEHSMLVHAKYGQTLSKLEVVPARTTVA